jgi:hypothetical protein
VLPLGIAFAVAGAALFWVPYRLTGVITDRLRLEQDVRSTWKLLVGIVLYALWLLVMVAVAGATFGIWAALLTMVGVPTIALVGLQVRERWQSAWDDARRFFLLRARHSMMDSLRERQHVLASRLDDLLARYADPR